MTEDRDKNNLKTELEKLKDHATEPHIYTHTVVITEDMTDVSGDLIEDKVPTPTPPDGFTYGEEIATQSPVCECYKLIPTNQ